MTKTLRGLFARRKLLWILCTWLAAIPAAPRAALAQGSADEKAVAQARKLFQQGSALYLAGKYSEALEALKTSRDLVPSPNSQLVIARCLRELGRLVDAQEMFAAAEVEARRRAAEGAPKYEPTANSAAAEGAAVRAALGTIRIRVEVVAADTTLEVDGVPTSFPPEGDVVVWHTPGDVVVSVRTAAGVEQKQLATIRAGAEITMSFQAPQRPMPLEPPSPARAPELIPLAPPIAARETPSGEGSSGASWATAAALTSGGLALAGGGMFLGFHVEADSVYQELLNSCGKTKSCGPADRPMAQRGKTDQLVANVSLIGGSVAAVAAVTFTVVALSHRSHNPGAGGGWHVLVGLTGVSVDREF